MVNRPIILAPAIIVLFLFLMVNAASADVSVGVKKGDWIEYTVTTTGTPEEGHDVTWARMEILDLKGTDITVNVTTKARNGTYESGIMNLNPAEGKVGVWFIIPANLNPGTAFFDASVEQNITVEGSEQRMIAGATRTVTHATTPERIKSWDKTTGVFVESIDTLQNYTLNALAYKTNMWESQILGLDPLHFYIAVLAAAVIAAATVTYALRRRKRPQ
jgi:hypothetical protein